MDCTIRVAKLSASLFSHMQKAGFPMTRLKYWCILLYLVHCEEIIFAALCSCNRNIGVNLK